MKILNKLGCLVVLYCFSTLSAANEQANDVRAIIEKSGLIGLSYQARHLAQQAMNDTAAPLSKQYEVVENIAPLWSVNSIEVVLTKALQQFTEQQQHTLIQLFDSPALLQAREKELHAVAEQSTSEYQHYVQQLRLNPPAEARLQAVQSLDDAMRFTALLQRTRQSVYMQLEQTLPSWQTPENWQDALHQQSLEFLLYVHRRTSNEALQRLIQSYQTPQMQQWLQRVEQGLPQTKDLVAVVTQ